MPLPPSIPPPPQEDLFTSAPYDSTSSACPFRLPPRSPVGIHQAENVLEATTAKAARPLERRDGARKMRKREPAVGRTFARLLFYRQSGGAAAACNTLQTQTCTGQESKCLRFSAVELYADKGLINAPYSVGDGSQS